MFIFNFSIGASLIFCAFFYGLNYSNLLLILPLEESPILQLASFLVLYICYLYSETKSTKFHSEFYLEPENVRRKRKVDSCSEESV